MARVSDRLQRRVGARPHDGGPAREGKDRQGRDRGDEGRRCSFIFSDGGLDESTVVCSVDPSSGSPVFTDGPFVETKEHLGGFAVVDVPNDAEARGTGPAGSRSRSAGPQEVHRFPASRAVPDRHAVRRLVLSAIFWWPWLGGRDGENG